MACNVDISKEFLDWGRKNFENNRLGLRNQEFLARDVFEVLSEFEEANRFFSVVLLDPPPFVQSISETDEEPEFVSARKKDNYARLLALASTVVEEGGLLVAFSNTRCLQQVLNALILSDATIRALSDVSWSRELASGINISDAALKIEEAPLGLPPDFRVFPQDRYANYLKSALVRKVAHDKLKLDI